MAKTNFPMVSTDWKAVGRDYVGFFPHSYPDLKFLKGEAFKAFADAMANEASDTCHDRLSGFLAPHGYQLWNMDSGGDDFGLFLVGDDEVDDFLADCATYATADFQPELERLAADAEPWVAPRKSAKKEKKSIIAESEYHREYGGILWGTAAIQIAEYDSDDGTVISLIDKRTFPTTGLEFDGFYDLTDDMSRLWGLHTVGSGQYWRWEKPQKPTKREADQIASLVFITDYQDLAMVDVEGMQFRRGAWNGEFGKGSSLFLRITCEGDDSRFNRDAPLFDPSPDSDWPLIALFQTVGLESRHVATLRQNDQTIPLSETEVLILGSSDDENRPYAVLDCAQGRLSASGHLPASPASPDAVHVLNHDEIVFAHTKVKPHPTHSHLTEKVGWLARFNLRTGAWTEAQLDGLYNDFTLNMAILKSQAPDRHRIRSFDGFIAFEHGHDDWCVMTYLTTQSGKHDLAWLWNTRTDAIIKIQQSDFPRRTPRFYYNPDLDRYLADESCRLDLLIPFEEFAAGREECRLQWSKQG